MLKEHTFESYSDKRVSYVIATKNHASDLEKALARCREFKDPQDELIVIDGVSDDHTKEVVEKNKDIVDIFISEPDLDATHATNKAFLLSRGRFVKTITDDDIFHPEGIKKAIEIFDQHPEIDLLLTGGSVEKNGKVTYIYIPPGTNFGKSIEDVFKYKLSGGCQFFRRKTFANSNLLPFRSVRPDGELLLRFMHAGATVKFCRLNTFHHFFSPSASNLRSEWSKKREKRKFWNWAAREFCSPEFARKYIIINTMQGSLLFKKLRKLRRLINRGIYRLMSVKEIESKPKEYIWDGGFS